jgi:phosphonate transport system substrate-binding protein
MDGARYKGKPIYFSDMIVRASSAARCVNDLMGCVWGYNEPTSHSGYALTRYWLALHGHTDKSFFGSVVATGAHLRSLELLLDGEIDATAIDSTVLETELRVHPSLMHSLRVLHTLGPSPIPPLVISRALALSARLRIRECLLRMHHDPEGAQILAAAAMTHFVAVTDTDYDPIRTMARLASDLPPWPEPDPDRPSIAV